MGGTGRLTISGSGTAADVASARSSGRTSAAAGAAKNGSRCNALTAVIPARHAQDVANNEVPTMAVGFCALLAARMATAVAGISWTLLVLIARNVHMAFVAVPGCGLSRSRSFMARKPSGVAALPRPSMLAAMFIIIAPMAGWSGGTSGNSRRITGRSPRASTCTRPERSASRMIPNHTASVPTNGRAMFITAVRAPSNAPLVTSSRCPAPSSTDTSTSASQM